MNNKYSKHQGAQEWLRWLMFMGDKTCEIGIRRFKVRTALSRNTFCCITRHWMFHLIHFALEGYRSHWEKMMIISPMVKSGRSYTKSIIEKIYSSGSRRCHVNSAFERKRECSGGSRLVYRYTSNCISYILSTWWKSFLLRGRKIGWKSRERPFTVIWCQNFRRALLRESEKGSISDDSSQHRFSGHVYNKENGMPLFLSRISTSASFDRPSRQSEARVHSHTHTDRRELGIWKRNRISIQWKWNPSEVIDFELVIRARGDISGCARGKSLPRGRVLYL